MRPGTRGGFALALIAAATALAGCGGDSSGGPASGGESVPVALPSSGCGSVELPRVKDPDGVVAALPAQYREYYAGYPDAVTKSVWSDFRPDHPPPYRVAVAFAQLTTEAQIKMFDSLKKALGNDPDIRLDALSTGQDVNLVTQLQQARTQLNKKPDLLVIEPIAEAFDDIVDKAGELGIPTVLMQVPSKSKYAINIVSNSYSIGAQGASVSFRQIGGKGNALFVHGIPSVTVDTLAFASYKDALKNCPEIKNLGEVTGAFQPGTAKAETLKFLATHPEPVHAVVQAGGMGPGIISAFKQAGRPLPVVVDRSGMQGSLGFWRDNRDEYNGFGQGFAPAKFSESVAGIVKRILAGGGVKASVFTAPYLPITAENLDDWARPGWNLNTQGIADGPPDAYIMPEGYIDAMFESPVPAPGTTKENQ